MDYEFQMLDIQVQDLMLFMLDLVWYVQSFHFFLKKLNASLPCDQAIPFLDVDPSGSGGVE